MLLGLQVRPVGNHNHTIGLGPQRPRAAGWQEAANETPDTGSHHLFVERVDIAGHRFVLFERVVVFGVVNSNQIPRDDPSLVTVFEQAGCPAFTIQSNGWSGIRQAVQETSLTAPNSAATLLAAPAYQLLPVANALRSADFQLALNCWETSASGTRRSNP